MRALDLTGRRFGQLTALRLVPAPKRTWECRCDCGKKRVVTSSQLTSGCTTTCGCWLERRRLRLVGLIFGKLTVISGVQKKTSTERTLFLCRCTCGKELQVNGSHLVNGHTQSCGCIRKGAPQPHKRKPFGVAHLNVLLGNYRRNAQTKGHAFKLSTSQFEALVRGECRYCGCKPETELKRKGLLAGWYYNGVDRLDNRQGYVPNNVVSCCRTCNFRKGATSFDEFTGWVRRVAARLAA
jgi:hypothetical protein